MKQMETIKKTEQHDVQAAWLKKAKRYLGRGIFLAAVLWIGMYFAMAADAAAQASAAYTTTAYTWTEFWKEIAEIVLLIAAGFGIVALTAE